MIVLDTVDSTNSYLAARASSLPHGEMVMAREQTAGRGQRGNSWEAAPGANLTLSILLRPQGFEAARQFDLSRAVALGVAGTVQSLLPRDTAARVAIKWPNDIYVDDRKIAGILIENSLSGRLIDRSIAGIGVNINQQTFESDAPNPVSVRQLTGRDTDLAAAAAALLRRVLAALELPVEELRARYDAILWRRDGFHPYRDNLRGEDFMGRIVSIAPTGHLTLADRATSIPRIFAFKEVTAIL